MRSDRIETSPVPLTDNGWGISVVLSHLLFTATEHGDDGEADGLNGECRRPVVRQYRQADVTVGVDVRVHRDVVANKRHLPDVIHMLC